MGRLRLSATAVIGLFLLGILGCGESLHVPTGKLMKGGAPLKISETAVLQMNVYEEADKEYANPHTVIWEKDGTFKVTGRTGKGIPPGKYKVSAVLIDPYPNGKDVLGGRMAKENAPVVDVKANTEIVLDVDKK
jgi:hypothetical protein